MSSETTDSKHPNNVDYKWMFWGLIVMVAVMIGIANGVERSETEHAAETCYPQAQVGYGQHNAFAYAVCTNPDGSYSTKEFKR